MNENPITSLNTGGVKKLDDAPDGDPQMNPDNNGGGNGGGGENKQPSRQGQPLMGIFAVVFGVISIFAWSIIFVPLALVLGVICLLRGYIFWGLGAIALAILGFLTSPMLLVMVGLGALAAYFGMPM